MPIPVGTEFEAKPTIPAIPSGAYQVEILEIGIIEKTPYEQPEAAPEKYFAVEFGVLNEGDKKR